MADEATPVPLLVVDDDPAQCHAIAAMLSSPERRVIEATSGEAALKVLLREPVVAMLVDVEMAGMGGFELARLVRARPSLHHLPILFVTSGYGDSDAVHRAYEAGAVDFLSKPLDPIVVRAKVDVFVELHLKEQALRRQDELLRDTERREAELRVAELRIAAARRFREFAEAMPQILFSTRPDGTVDYFNERWFAYTGLTLPAAGARWEAALDPADREAATAAWQRSLAQGEPFEAECRLVGVGGAARWHLVRGVPLHGSRGELEAWLCTCTDVDEAKRTGLELAEFRATLDAAVECVCLVDEASLALSYANHGASVLLGYPREELVGLPLTSLTAEHDEAALRELMGPLATREPPASTIETHFRRREGELVPVELLLQLIPIREGRGGRGGRVAAIARDITARKADEAERARLFEQAQDAIRVRDDFLAVASHDLRTPMSALNLQLQVLERTAARGAPEPEKLRAWIEGMHRQLGRFGRLVDALFDVTRISEGKLQLRVEDVDLAELIRGAVEQARPPAQDAGCELRVEVPDALRGRWDPLRLEQVVTNLIANAVKYGSGGPVEIEASAREHTVRLVVRDHGIGIPADKLERIFVRFERGGLGLGLYIAREIVRAHGGTIAVESRPGEGSTFTVEVPRLADAAQGAQGTDPGAAPRETPGEPEPPEKPEPEPV
jgi:PAS domain S-box-containing protein